MGLYFNFHTGQTGLDVFYEVSKLAQTVVEFKVKSIYSSLLKSYRVAPCCLSSPFYRVQSSEPDLGHPLSAVQVYMGH